MGQMWRRTGGVANPTVRQSQTAGQGAGLGLPSGAGLDLVRPPTSRRLRRTCTTPATSLFFFAVPYRNRQEGVGPEGSHQPKNDLQENRPGRVMR